ncbi:MAG: 3'(2'),5'-bisphosphate nucleotidase CysQ [Alphaproteobacteria bacterium]|nr:3'(2'),5'-bisphosphate nucleotidase CysQ [Alphaproteobacteria bacterium]
MPEPDAKADLDLLCQTVLEAGSIARGFFGGAYKRWSKEQGSPVTEADLAVDAFLRKRLCAARPAYGWLSEESEDDKSRLGHDTLFIVDPIDGTVAFLKARPHFTICAAVVHDGRPVAGVVYNPILDEMFTAARGDGATMNQAPIRVSDRQQLDGCRMLTSRDLIAHPAWSTPPNRAWPAMEIENRSSIAYRMALVANGSFDAMMALSAKRDWDLAAAEIVLTEAGGLVSTHDGSVLRYNTPGAMHSSVIGAGPKLHAAIIERVAHLVLPRK